MDPSLGAVILHDEAYAPIDSITTGGVVRLCVNALVAAGGVFDETADDNSVAQGDTLLEVLNVPYINNGTVWIRAQGGTDNASAGTANQGAFAGGIVTSPVDAFADGDFSLLHFDTSGRLLTNATTSGVTDTDDDAIAASQVADLVINENYGYDGSNWRRFRAKAASAATSDERLMHLSTMAVLAMIDTGAPAGSQEIPVAVNRNVSTAMTETGYFLPTRSAVTGIDASAGAGSQNVPVVARNFDAAADVAAALVGLLVNARLAALDLVAGDFAIPGLIYKSSIAGTAAQAQNGVVTYSGNESEFAAARRGGRFFITHQTPGTLITAQLAFVETTPTLMYRINAATIKAILRSINISVQNTPGAPVFVTVAIDAADRYSAGGTAVALQNSNEESAVAAVGLAYTNPTATAAGAGTRYLGTWVGPAAAGASFDLQWGDGVLLGATAATLLIYVYAATTAPNISFVIDLEEVS